MSKRKFEFVVDDDDNDLFAALPMFLVDVILTKINELAPLANIASTCKRIHGVARPHAERIATRYMSCVYPRYMDTMNNLMRLRAIWRVLDSFVISIVMDRQRHQFKLFQTLRKTPLLRANATVTSIRAQSTKFELDREYEDARIFVNIEPKSAVFELRSSGFVEYNPVSFLFVRIRRNKVAVRVDSTLYTTFVSSETMQSVF